MSIFLEFADFHQLCHPRDTCKSEEKNWGGVGGLLTYGVLFICSVYETFFITTIRSSCENILVNTFSTPTFYFV